MARRRIAAVFLVLFAHLAGCGAKDPASAQQEAASELQTALEDKQTAAVLQRLHPDFQAAGQFDRQWAEQTMRGLFLRYRNIRILVFSQSHRLDPGYHDRAHSEAEVAITGADGLIPDSARRYRVRLEWWLENDQWQLARLDWE